MASQRGNPALLAQSDTWTWPAASPAAEAWHEDRDLVTPEHELPVPLQPEPSRRAEPFQPSPVWKHFSVLFVRQSAEKSEPHTKGIKPFSAPPRRGHEQPSARTHQPCRPSQHPLRRLQVLNHGYQRHDVELSIKTRTVLPVQIANHKLVLREHRAILLNALPPPIHSNIRGRRPSLTAELSQQACLAATDVEHPCMRSHQTRDLPVPPPRQQRRQQPALPLHPLTTLTFPSSVHPAQCHEPRKRRCQRLYAEIARQQSFKAPPRKVIYMARRVSEIPQIL